MLRLLAGKTRAASSELGWNDPTGHFGHAVGAKRGSFQPSSVFCPRPNSSPRTAQPLALHNLRVTVEVTRTVPDTVNRVFHAPVTVANIFGRRGVLSRN